MKSDKKRIRKSKMMWMEKNYLQLDQEGGLGEEQRLTGCITDSSKETFFIIHNMQNYRDKEEFRTGR